MTNRQRLLITIRDGFNTHRTSFDRSWSRGYVLGLIQAALVLNELSGHEAAKMVEIANDIGFGLRIKRHKRQARGGR